VYVPPHNRNEDRAEQLAFMRAHSFAAVVTAPGGRPRATHLPCLIEESGERVRIVAHLARANPQWRDFDGVNEALVIFTGPHAYVSPRHYDRTASVPTWNYVAVHASGPVRVIEERDAKVALLERLIAETEPAYRAQFDALPADYREKMLGGMVGFAIDVERIDARYKLSQEKAPAERERIIAEYESAATDELAALARMMRERGR